MVLLPLVLTQRGKNPLHSTQHHKLQNTLQVISKRLSPLLPPLPQ